MRSILPGWVLFCCLVTAAGVQAESVIFSDDFSESPVAGGKWTIVQNGSTNMAHVASRRTFYLTRPGGECSGMYMMANTPLTSRRWEAFFRYRIGGLYGGGADGLVFLFYKKGGYIPGSGGFIGFNPDSGFSQPGYGIVIDNYHNGWDPSGSYIGLITRTTNVFSDKLAYVDDPRTEDGRWHSMVVRFDEGDISVYVDGGLILRHRIDVPDYTYSGVGFSSGICVAQNNHEIANFILRDLGAPPPAEGP